MKPMRVIGWRSIGNGSQKEEIKNKKVTKMAEMPPKLTGLRVKETWPLPGWIASFTFDRFPCVILFFYFSIFPSLRFFVQFFIFYFLFFLFLLSFRPVHSTDFSVLYISPFYFFHFSTEPSTLFFNFLPSLRFDRFLCFIFYFFDITDYSAYFFYFFSSLRYSTDFSALFFFFSLDFRQYSLFCVFFLLFFPSLFLPFYSLVLDIV